jgi:hypothetical protein
VAVIEQMVIMPEKELEAKMDTLARELRVWSEAQVTSHRTHSPRTSYQHARIRMAFSSGLTRFFFSGFFYL